VAAGSDRSILDIVALNVRTEIAFGRFSDGCTALAWHTEKRAYLGQNWDVSPDSFHTALSCAGRPDRLGSGWNDKKKI
jgi:hypothetical protein